MTSLYDASIPVLTRALQTIETLLDKAEEFAKETGTPTDDLLSARLYPDMFPASKQITISVLATRNALQMLVDKDVKQIEMKEYSLEESRGLLTDALGALAAVKPESVNGKESELVAASVSRKKATVKAQDCTWITMFSLSRPSLRFGIAARHVFRFIVPTIHFHLTTMYAILRMKGVPIGKSDFLTHLIDGWVFE
ncbi:hypothetical protein F4677DRAFT_451022 [Hypoxylon crocopeplum]|nr:hypothetical protein F4677DRAFT_451022 [Hypoxylon crocopeplum]